MQINKRAETTIVSLNICFFLSLALSLDDQTGNFEVGKHFDALRVDVTAPGGPIDLIQCEGPKVGSGALFESIGWHKQTHLQRNQIKQK